MEERTEFMNKGPYTILLADDDPDDPNLFAEAAASIDPTMNIMMFKDGVLLMEYLNSPHTDSIDMIFLDLNMPKKNGLECLKEIVASQSLKKIPVIIYTTSLNPIDIENTYLTGATRFFKKPNSFDELKDIFLKACRHALDINRSMSKESFLLNGSSGW